MDSKQNQTLSILRELWTKGNNIFIAMDSSDSLERYMAQHDAIRWIEEAKVYFKKLFFNPAFYEDFSTALARAYDNYDNFDEQTALSLLLGHITGLGKMLKYNYVKDQLSGINNDASQICFVAMSFAEEHEDIYTIGIKPAIESLGYEAIRVDKVHHNEKIDSKIYELINQSRFVVADFTGQRNGVYYEAGYAKGLGLPIIQTCQQNDFEHLHFDVKTIHTVSYATASKLQTLLRDHVEKSIGRYKPCVDPVVKNDNDILF